MPIAETKTPRTKTRTPSRTPPSHSVGSQSPNRTTHEVKEKSKSPKTPKRIVEDLGVDRTQQETLKRSKERMRNDQKTMSNINEDLNIPLAGEKTPGDKDDFDDYLNNLGEHKTKKSREKGSKENKQSEIK